MNYSQFLAALCLWREARGESLAALHAIWNVIRNRATDSAHRWPRTISGVVLQPHQFSSFSTGDPNAVKFPQEPASAAIASADWTAWLNAQIVVSDINSPDPTNGANSYESLPPDAERPGWAQADKITLVLGPFRFYKL